MKNKHTALTVFFSLFINQVAFSNTTIAFELVKSPLKKTGYNTVIQVNNSGDVSISVIDKKGKTVGTNWLSNNIDSNELAAISSSLQNVMQKPNSIYSESEVCDDDELPTSEYKLLAKNSAGKNIELVTVQNPCGNAVYYSFETTSVWSKIVNALYAAGLSL